MARARSPPISPVLRVRPTGQAQRVAQAVLALQARPMLAQAAALWGSAVLASMAPQEPVEGCWLWAVLASMAPREPVAGCWLWAVSAWEAVFPLRILPGSAVESTRRESPSQSVEREGVQTPCVPRIGRSACGPRQFASRSRVNRRALRAVIGFAPATPRVKRIGTVAAMRVLVVDDEVDLAEAIARGLRREGYAVDVAHDGEEALEKARLTPYDLICLDITMPKMDGRAVCRAIRAEPVHAEPPRILMLTARDEIQDRVAGLDDGADDYLVKPFAFPELTARVRTLMRRDAASSGSQLRVGPIVLDTAAHSVTRSGEPVSLTSKEFALLRYFMGQPGVVISQEALLEHVWDENADPFTNTVRVTVGTLRRKLTVEGDEPPIETVIGAGYRLLDLPAE